MSTERRRIFIFKQWQRINNLIQKKIYNLQGVLLFIILLGIAFLVFIQVILRYVLHHPLMGIEELLLFPAIWLYFLGNANASLERTQIKAPVINLFVKSPRALKSFRIVMGLTSFAIVIWLTYWAYKYFLYSLRVPKLSSSLYAPLIYAECFVFIGFLLMSIYTFAEIMDDIIILLSEYKLNNNKQ